MRLVKKTLRAALLPVAALVAAAFLAPSDPSVASAASQPGMEASRPAEPAETCEARPREASQDWMKFVVRGAIRLLT